MKITQKFPLGNLRDNPDNQDYYKLIIPPPFIPNPDFINEPYINKSFGKNNQNIYNNFRFKNVGMFNLTIHLFFHNNTIINILFYKNIKLFCILLYKFNFISLRSR